MQNLHLGVDIGGSHIAVGVVDEAGNLLLTLDHQMLNNTTITPDEIISIIYGLISQATFTLVDGETSARSPMSYFEGKFDMRIVSVGIACPGQCKNGVIVVASNLPLLKNAPLASKLSARLDGIPVVLVNDADAAVAAEVWSKETASTYRENENVAMITLGTGIGFGLVLNRRLFTGSHGLTEGGHMICSPPEYPSAFPQLVERVCGCGQLNCVESFASAKSVTQRFMETKELSPGDVLGPMYNGKALNAKAVFHEALAGDLDAERVINDAAQCLAIMVINVCRVVDPEVIIFGGGMSQSGEPFLHRVRGYVKALSWTVLPVDVKLVLAKSSVNAGILGAAMAGKHDRAVSGEKEAESPFMREHGTKLLTATSVVSIVSMVTVVALLLARKK